MRIKSPAWQRRDDLFLVPAGGWVLIGVVLLSVFLAGGRPIWAQGIIAAGIGFLWLKWPPEKTPGRPVRIMLILLAVAPLTAYLPGAFLAMPDWRVNLREFPAIVSSPFVTPQPWLTFHVWLLWLSGVALAAWCAYRDWDHYNRGTLVRMYAGGMLGITLFAIFGYATGYQPGWWSSTDGFGPFLNRNQWGAAMGFAGVASVALVHQCFRQENRVGLVFWALAAAVFAGGTIFNGSRGGLVILAAGSFGYGCFYGVLRKEYRYAAISLSLLLIFFALFAVSGGHLLERFVGLRSLLESGGDEDLRVQYYRMTMAMVAAAPLTGFGLGNFEHVFPFYLDYEPIFDRRPVHPESSWLWLASEGGWLLLVVVAAALAVLALQAYFARKSRAATERSLALACATMLAVVAAFEVNGHRIGVLFPVILLASLALPNPKDNKWSPRLLALSRAGGGLLMVVGLLWILAGTGLPLLPSAQGISALQARAVADMDAGRDAAAIDRMTRCAKLRPLDWNLHWTLSGWLRQDNQLEPAWQQFRAANALLPYLYWTIEKEAVNWISVAPGRAVIALLDAMSRAPEAKRPEMYARFLQKSAESPALRSLLLKLFPDDPEFEFVRIQQSSRETATKRLPRFIQETDNLSTVPDHLVAPAMRFMLHHGHADKIDALVEENPRLKRLGWEVLVERETGANRRKEALDLYFSYGPKPSLPAALSRSDLRSIERAAALAPMDIATGIAYYQALSAARREDEAFWQLRRLMEYPEAPAYIWYLAAQTSHRRGDYEEAWGFLRTYQEKVKK